MILGWGNLLLTGWEECLENQQNSAGEAQCVATLMWWMICWMHKEFGKQKCLCLSQFFKVQKNPKESQASKKRLNRQIFILIENLFVKLGLLADWFNYFKILSRTPGGWISDWKCYLISLPLQPIPIELCLQSYNISMSIM